MKVWTLMETDTDTAGPAVNVYLSQDEAIVAAIIDIVKNRSRIVAVEEDEQTWTCHHVNGTEEHISEVREHTI